MNGGLDTAGQTAWGLALLSSGPGRGQQGPPYRLQLIRARLQATERTDTSLTKILYQKIVVWRPRAHTAVKDRSPVASRQNEAGATCRMDAEDVAAVSGWDACFRQT